jgi:VanZ family protein
MKRTGLPLLRRTGLLLVLGVIFWLSHQPSLRLVPPLFPMQDKVLHAVEFTVLGLALLWNRDLFGTKYGWGLMAAAGILWAAADEVHQSFVVGRDCSSGDFLADSAGLMAVMLVLGRRIGREKNRGSAPGPGSTV